MFQTGKLVAEHLMTFVDFQKKLIYIFVKKEIMTFIQFIKSKSLWISVAIAAIIIVGLAFISLKFLDVYTRHGQEIAVPDLAKSDPARAKLQLENMGLEMTIVDTIDFKKDFPPLSIVEQDPKATSKVKDGRTVYVKINAANYASVTLPNLIDNTFRYAVSRVEGLGLVKGNVRYEPHLAEDVVIQIEQNGRILKEGDKVLKHSTIDFLLGDGSLSYRHRDSINQMFEDLAPAIDSIY